MSNVDFSSIISWHKSLTPGQRATLRRCKTLAEVCLHPCYVALCQDLRDQRKQVALIVGILAHIKSPEDYAGKLSFSKQMAAVKKASDSPKVSRSRFQRLLTLKDPEQRFRLLVRLVKQIDDFHLIDFSKDLFYWGDNTKKQWAYDYYSSDYFLNGEKHV